MYKIAQSILISFSIVLSSCGGDVEPNTAMKEGAGVKTEINIGGSSTLYPISKGIVDLYAKDGVAINIERSGSVAGLEKLAKGSIDIAGASRKMNAEELKLCQENGVEVLELEVALDGMTVIVNAENDWLKNISVSELKKLWEPKAEENVIKWSDVNEAWPSEKFRLFGPGAASGTYDFFTKAIVGETGAIRTDYLSSENDHEIVKGVAAEKNGIGFIGLAYYGQNRDKLNVLSINNIEPTLKTIMDGSYPQLTRSLYIYVSKKDLKSDPLKSFVSYYLENTSNVALSVGYIPVDAKVIQKSQKALSSVINQ